MLFSINDLNEKIDFHIQRALAEEDAMIYAFGERWGPEPNRRDKYFGFKPGNGIHDIHMNQGSGAEFKKYNGVWQDGGMLIHLPSQNRWVAVFLFWKWFQNLPRPRSAGSSTIGFKVSRWSLAGEIGPEGRI
jgi:uncharacterized protein YukJ